MVADIDHVDIFISPAEEQIQQDIKALGHVFGGWSIEPETSIRQNITAWLEGSGRFS